MRGLIKFLGKSLVAVFFGIFVFTGQANAYDCNIFDYMESYCTDQSTCAYETELCTGSWTEFENISDEKCQFIAGQGQETCEGVGCTFTSTPYAQCESNTYCWQYETEETCTGHVSDGCLWDNGCDSTIVCGSMPTENDCDTLPLACDWNTGTYEFCGYVESSGGGMPTLESSDVSTFLSALGVAMTGIVAFLVSGAGLFLTLATAFFIIFLLKRWLNIKGTYKTAQELKTPVRPKTYKSRL